MMQLRPDSNRQTEPFDELKRAFSSTAHPSTRRVAVPRNSAMAFVKMKFGVAR